MQQIHSESVQFMNSSNALPEETPPVFQTWWGWYRLVLGTLAALILLFTLFSRAFR